MTQFTYNESWGVIMYQLGEKIRESRKNCNFTQKQLADKLGIQAATFSRYENNELDPPIYNLCKIASILHVSLDFLCSMESAGNISMMGLTTEQKEIVQKLTTTFRNHNVAISKSLSAEQYELLGEIVAEFSK